jgi:hypothetical protein
VRSIPLKLWAAASTLLVAASCAPSSRAPEGDASRGPVSMGPRAAPNPGPAPRDPQVVAVTEPVGPISPVDACGGCPVGTTCTTINVASGFCSQNHPAFPQVPDQGGGVIHDVSIVEVDFTGDYNLETLQSFTTWIAGSSWASVVGSDYGVDSMTVENQIVIDNPWAPGATASDAEIVTLLQNIGSSFDYDVVASEANLVYAVYLPPTITSDISVGYHSSFQDMKTRAWVSYAVATRSGWPFMDDVANEETTMSHEIIEAATDPTAVVPGVPLGYSLYNLTGAYPNPWANANGGEVADMCVWSWNAYETNAYTFYAQRIWSNSAAALGLDPCVPRRPDVPYFNVFPANLDGSFLSGNKMQASPGAVITLNVTGWSLESEPGGWPVCATASYLNGAAGPANGSGLVPSADCVLGGEPCGSCVATGAAANAPTVYNGSSVPLTITVPSSATSADFIDVSLTSFGPQYVDGTTTFSNSFWAFRIDIAGANL